jgi:hypothetical protein
VTPVFAHSKTNRNAAFADQIVGLVGQMVIGLKRLLSFTAS